MAQGQAFASPGGGSALAFAAVVSAVALVTECLSPDWRSRSDCRALKFALRLGALAGFAGLVARLDPRDWIWGFRALAFSGSVAGVLAVAEGWGSAPIC